MNPKMLRTSIVVALLLGGLGLVVSRPQILLWLNQQSPELDFVAWYILLFVYLQVTSFVLFRRLDILSFRYGFAAIILYFAASIVFFWPASNYALIAVGASPVGQGGTPAFLLATEDQITYAFWHTFLPFVGNDVMGLLIYVVTPILLVLFVALFLAPKQLGAALRGLLRPL